MKKQISALFVALSCACALMLSACGQAPSSAVESASSKEEADKSTAAEASDNACVGTWELAVLKAEGMTITGDFSLFFKDGKSITLEVKDDKTATMSFGTTDVDFTWEQVDDSTIQAVSSDTDDEQEAQGVLGDYDTMSLTLTDDSLVMALGTSEDESSTELIFTVDGTLKGYEPLTGDDGVDISSTDELVGDWKLCGLSMATMTIYGTADDLSQMVGGSADISMTIRKDGTGTVMGSDFTWKTDDGSTVFSYDDSTTTVKTLDGDIILDMTTMLGGEVLTVMRFTR